MSKHVEAPAELARRLARSASSIAKPATAWPRSLKPGQRLVSPEGDLWRWDGFAAAAHAPTGAARRLAERARLADIEAELLAARADAETARGQAEAAQSALQAAAAAETEARNAARERQRDANAARDRHDAAEREVNRNAARLSALAEAQTRLTASRDETNAARAQAEQSLAALAPAADLETELAGVRDDIAGKRAHLAEVRAEQQAIVREAEIADRRLNQLGGEKAGWVERQQGARNQTETLEQRIAEATRDRAELEDAPRLFGEKRQALIGEVQNAEAERQACADRLQESENALGRSRPRRPRRT